MKRPKYGNSKVVNTFGKFDSELEWSRYLFLMSRAEKGEITDLQRQVEFPLLPAQYRTKIKHLKTKDKEVQVLVERPCVYRADFVYKRGEDVIVEDVKGSQFLQTPEFKLKKKMMLYFHNIEISIVTRATNWGKLEPK